MRVTLLDYGAGNLHSLAKAIVSMGHAVSVEPDPRAALNADVLVLPGVGAFGIAAAHVASARDLLRAAARDGLPVVGICLGMQLLFDESDEGVGVGLGLFAGRVERLRATRTPHIGWNTVTPMSDPTFGDATLRWAYYAHSFVARPADENIVAAWTTYENDRFPAIVRAGRVIGMQFHPEKSSTHGIRILSSALEACVAWS
jgi:glutamine amidotransferase